ncbi:conserved hypothetical protein [Candidatus Sulfopaludibacter sp. SbA3]|nr:conserved hypothetical protein [Candidatus Sulfopaludibacter sp. SbA3]
MPRRNRCVLPGLPCHITQRGVDRRETFSTDQDRAVYLRLLRQNLPDSEVRLLGWCLMPNHVHLIAVPHREDSLAVLLRRVHGRYAQYFNASAGRNGHLWQNRFFACVLDEEHLWTALSYVDRNPVRAGMVNWAADYQWSSATAHVTGVDECRVVDMDWWRLEGRIADWAQEIDAEELQAVATLRRCTFAGRPFGNEDFVAGMSHRFGRHWERGRPKTKAPVPEK